MQFPLFKDNVSYKMIKMAYYVRFIMNKVTNRPIAFPSGLIHPTFSIMNTNMGGNQFPMMWNCTFK